jgi:hypothetical protein
MSHQLHRGPLPQRELVGKQYHLRLETVVRSHCEDVTSQVIKAYQQTIASKIKDYVKERPALIAAAAQWFFQNLAALAHHIT